MVEPATKETVRNTTMKTGSARKPTMRVRLAPIGPYGLPVSTAARVVKKAAEREDEARAQHVAHEGEFQRVAGEDRDQQRDENRRRERDIGRRPEDPGGMVGNDLVLVQQLPQIAIGLEDTGAAPGLEDLLEPVGDAFGERRKADHNGDLEQVIKDAGGHDLSHHSRLSAHPCCVWESSHRIPPPSNSTYLRPACISAGRAAGRSYQPEGGYGGTPSPLWVMLAADGQDGNRVLRRNRSQGVDHVK